MGEYDGPVFPAAPPERVALSDGLALVRPAADLVASAVESINASLDHLRPWMDWAAEPATEAAIAEVYGTGDEQWAARRDFLYVLIDEASREVLGGSGLHARLGPMGLEIGYWIRADLANRGLATAAARALTTAALTVPGVARVRISCEPDNVRSARVPQKLGYRYVGEFDGDGGRRMQRWEVEAADWVG